MYESISIVGERGQITIPKLIREVAKIDTGNSILVKLENHQIIIQKVDATLKKTLGLD